MAIAYLSSVTDADVIVSDQAEMMLDHTCLQNSIEKMASVELGQASVVVWDTVDSCKVMDEYIFDVQTKLQIPYNH